MRIIATLLLVIICSSSVISQEPLDALSPRFIVTKAECSRNSHLLQSIDSTTESDDLIIIVSHLGKSEKNKMADRRLHNARTFLSRFTIMERSPERIIISKGEESSGEGFLNFFVKGQLELRINFPKNRDLLVQPCVQDREKKPCSDEDARLYYPCKANN